MKKIAIAGLILLVIGAAFIGAQEKRIYNNGEIDYLPNNAKIQLFADDMGSSLQRIEYSVDAGAIKKYTGPIALSGEGRHFIAYRAIDTLGNISLEKAYSCVVDASPPYFTATAKGPAFLENGVAYGTGDTAVILWAKDELSGVSDIYFSIDGGGYMKYTGPGYLETEGKHTGRAYAVDNVGNRTKTYEVTAYVDNTPPKVSIVPADSFVKLQGSNYTASSNTYTIRASDNIAGVKEIMVSLDGSEYFTYTEPFSVQQAGSHTIRAKAVDYLDNMSDAVEVEFSVDVDLPETGYELILE